MIEKYKFRYVETPLDEIVVHAAMDEDTGRRQVSSVIVCGVHAEPSTRFWTSLYARYGFNRAFTDYFTHEEIFSRIAQKHKDTIRVCLEENEDTGEVVARAASNPEKPVVPFCEHTKTLTRFGAEKVSYSDGLVYSMHEPRAPSNFNASGDRYESRFQLVTPIDGYGLPNIYLAIVRQPGDAYLIGQSKAFKSGLSLGKGEDSVQPAIARALESFSNDEGYAALRKRLEAATHSWASVREVETFYDVLSRLLFNSGFAQEADAAVLGEDPTLQETAEVKLKRYRSSPIIAQYLRVVGEFSEIYGIANPSQFSAKRQRLMPMNCAVYDVFRYLSDVASRHATPDGAVVLHSAVGNLICEEYDLEESKKKFPKLEDFRIQAKLKAGATGSEVAEKAADAKLAS